MAGATASASTYRTSSAHTHKLSHTIKTNNQTTPGDDFECTSSPAVEQTVRTIARDLQRCAFTRASFQPDATYEDGFRCAGKTRLLL